MALSLSATTDTIEAKLAAAHTTNAAQCYVTWRDITTTAVTVGRTVIDTNGTTAVVITAAPAASTQRVIDTITIMNNDTVSHTVSVTFDANATEYTIIKATLLAGETLCYTDGAGWSVMTAANGVKVAGVSGLSAGAGWSTTILGADVTNNNAVANTIADITGLTFSVTAHRMYLFRYWFYYTTASINTGIRLSLSGPASPTVLRFRTRMGVNTAATTIYEGMTAYDEPSTAAGSCPTGGAVGLMEGYIQPSADGTVIGRLASEVASSAATVKQGSFVEYLAVT